MKALRFFLKVLHFVGNLVLTLATLYLFVAASQMETYPEWSYEAAEGGNDMGLVVSLIVLIFIVLTVISWVAFFSKKKQPLESPR